MGRLGGTRILRAKYQRATDGSFGVRRLALNLIRISNVSTIVSCVILTAVNRFLTVAALMNVREDELQRVSEPPSEPRP